MGFFRFRRSIKLFPGVRINLNKKSTSMSFGGKGFTYTVGGKGSRTTVGIPGTGLSYTSVQGNNASSNPQPVPSSNQGKSNRGCGCAMLLIGIPLIVGLLAQMGSSTSSSPRPQKPSIAIPAETKSSNPTQPLTAVHVPQKQPTTSFSDQGNSVNPTTAPTRATTADAVIQFPVPTVRKSAAEIARIQKFVPSVLTLRTRISAPLTENGQTVGVTTIPPGTKVQVSSISGASAIVETGGSRFSVALSNTDFLEQVVSNANK